MFGSKQPDDDDPTADGREPIRAEFDWSAVTPSMAVIETVAIAANREPTDLKPLYETIDPDALDTIIRSMGTDSTDGDATVSFVLDGYQVAVQRDGSVVVRPDAVPPEEE